MTPRQKQVLDYLVRYITHMIGDSAAFPCGLTTNALWGMPAEIRTQTLLPAVKPVIQPFFCRPRWTRTYAAFPYRLTGRCLEKTSCRGNSFLCRLFFGCPVHPAATVVCALGEADRRMPERRASRSVRMSVFGGILAHLFTLGVYHDLTYLYTGVFLIPPDILSWGKRAVRFKPKPLVHKPGGVNILA